MSDVKEESAHGVDVSGSLVTEPARRSLSGSKKLMIAIMILASSLSIIWTIGFSKKKEAPPLPLATVDTNAEPFRPVPIEVVPNPPAEQVAQPSARTLADSSSEVDDPQAAQSAIFAYNSGDQLASHPQKEEQNGTSLHLDEAALENDLSTRMKPGVAEPSRATLLPHPDFMITQGTIIPCVLQTAINTNLPGYVKCVLPQDVRGATNNVVLLDRGTTVVGEIQRGLRQGDARVFVIWNRAETPNHALVSLVSPGADELGRSGMPGIVDNHFWQRFGGAMLLSVVQGTFQAASQYGESSGGPKVNIQGNGGQTVDTALEATVNIPPTLKKDQGDAVSIFVARDLDFSEIYELKATTAPKRRSR
ncbi:type IV secretory pathway, VirB10 component [Rhizobium leguminosarum bv. trifolii WSM2297]|uniref:Type IV secretory pathway, VirB10 component n=1 Tax=Rhizobium leguminosarum bv. trifolii WSM2297 TaxID=754762 RepID=J0W4X5_RHILT|nr:type IV secretion system protein VirB10 [Rhizobium leguminosarum]EJC80771.1 type IV secretory pathway, VirB10 component [Rhizobium leguminosarum bv. trifolii WSM2297]